MQEENVGLSSSDAQKQENNFTRKLVCVNYPGIVENVEKMVDTLGGLPEIENVVGQRSRYLELRFRPEDRFCKPALSETDKRTGILVKVNRKELRGKEDYNYEVLGVNAMSYSFNKYCDFQYLPLVTSEKETPDTPLRCFYNELYPDSIPAEDWLTKEEVKEMPPFLPSGIFSRFDYHQQNSTIFNKKTPNLCPPRSKTPRHNVIMRFNDENIPSGPPETVMQFIEIKSSMKANYELAKKMFEERPVWSKAAMLYLSKIPEEHGKFILPAIAYFNKNGPWRSMWVRYGFDPRKNPSARVYQTFDFRVRAICGLKEIVKNKRQRLPADKRSLDEVVKHKDESNVVSENVYTLKPGLLPAGRQVFYQICDVKLPEIQTMLSRLPPILPGTKCDVRNGWLPDKFNDQCREIANKYIEEVVQKQSEESKKQNPANSSEKNDNEKIVEMLEISDSDSELSDSEIMNNEFSSEDEEKQKRNEDSDDDFIDVEAADEVANFLGKISEK